MSRSQWAAWLLMLCAVHAATVMVSASSVQLSELQGDQLLQIHLSADLDGQFSFSGQASNRRLLASSRLQQHSRNLLQQGSLNQQQALDKLLSDVKQMKDGSNMDMKPLIEMARAASGPDQVVIVDDSLAARNMRRGGTQAEEETIVVPVYEPSASQFAAPVVVVPTMTAQPPALAPTVAAVPSNAQQVFVPVPAGDGQISQVEIIGQPGQPTPPIAFIPTKPITPEAPRGPYCIPHSAPGQSFAVLAAGDSITQGSVPSKNLNHPYTIKMEQLLEASLQGDVRAVDAGLGGGGVFMTGFNVPVTFGPWLDTYLQQGPWNVVVIMIGINDLLRGGRQADDIMNGLKPMISQVLASNTPVILIPPFAAPGFVQENDSKEAERKKFARLLRNYCTEHAASTGGKGPQAWMLDLQASPPFDFYNMPAGDRSKWLDDGLHMTELAYDTIGEMVAAEISKRTCAIPTTSNSS